MIRLKQILSWMILLIMVSSCQKKELDLVFGETPEVRMNAKIDSILTALVSSPNGWKANVATSLKGGYGFYFAFNRDQVVEMVADLTDASASNLVASNYRVKQDNGATLIFDTYNYISMLNDPNPNVYNGTIREGLRSDLEYRFKRSTADTIVFVGKRYANELVLVKATKAESDQYRGGAYKTGIDLTKKFFTDNANPYIEVEGEGGNYQMAITISNANKIFELASLLPDGTTSAASGKFAYTLDGLEVINDGLTYRGVTLKYAVWEAGKLFMIDSKGKKYEIKNSLQPLLPLYKLIGSKYVGFRSPFLTYFPGTSPAGLTILQRFHNGLASGTGYSFNNGYLDIGFDVLNKRVTLSGFSSQNGGTSGWITTIVYNYTLDDQTGIYTLKLRDAAAGGYTAPILNLMDDFLKNSRIKFDYHTDSGVLYGKLIGVDRPNVIMTFRMR